MPTWGELLGEINGLIAAKNPNAFDVLRKKYLQELHNHTKRNTIIYASRWTTGDVPANLTSITDEDIQGFMEATYGLKGETLFLG